MLLGYKPDIKGVEIVFKDNENLIYMEIKSKSHILSLIPVYLNCTSWERHFNILEDTLYTSDIQNIMLIGDFNARTGTIESENKPQNLALRRSRDTVLNREGRKIIDLCNSFGLSICNGSTQGDAEGDYTFIGPMGSSVIDYAMVAGDWCNLMNNFEVISQIHSDHLPIQMSFQLSTNQENADVLNTLPTKYKWKQSVANRYIAALESNISRQLDPSVQYLSLSKIDDSIAISIPTTCLPKNIRTNFREKWFDKECSEARQKSFGWLRLLRKYPQNQLIKREYLALNNCLKSLLKSKRQAYFESIAQDLSSCRDASQFWSKVRFINNDNKWHQSSLPLNLEDLKDHFENLTKDMYCTTFQFAIPFQANEVLDAPFSISEVKTVLDELSNNKAPGSNGIPSEFYKFSPPILVENLTSALNYAYDHGCVPNYFKKSIVTPIFKKGDRTVSANYRGISLLNTSMKILTKILYKRLYNWVQINNLLRESQAGFRKNYSTIDQIYTLTSIAEIFIKDKKKLYAFFIDFKAAFDTIDRKALMLKLYNKGISTKFGRILETLYDTTTSVLAFKDNLSEPYEVEIGLRQGCNLSPLLFALFIDDIEDVLQGGATVTANLLVKTLKFADDIVVFAETPESLQLMINRISEYCNKWRLQVNLSKSKVMIFRNGGGPNCRNESWRYDNQRIEVVSDYNYLGVKISRNLNLRNHMTEKLAKSKNALNATWKSVMQNKDVSFKTKFRIFETTAKAIMCYAAQVWGHTEFDEVEQLLRYFLKRTLRLPSCTANHILMLETGLPPVFISTLKMQVDYILKTVNMEENRLPRRLTMVILRRKLSWFDTWRNLATYCGRQLILDENIGRWKADLYDLISAVDDRKRDEFVVRARQSTNRLIYARLDYNLSTESYFKEEYSTALMSLVLKTRGELLSLNFMPHRDDRPEICSLCNQGAREDIHHFLGKCPILRETRSSVFGKSELSEDEMSSILNGGVWKSLFQYVKLALYYRNRIMKELF